MKYLLISFLFFFLSVDDGAAQATIPPQNEKRNAQLQKERDKLARTTDPVDRTKTGINISRILLTSATEAAKAHDLPQMEQFLTQFRETVGNANETMMKSGRDAHKKSSGFKDLEIYLRGSLRQLDDIGEMLSFEERGPVEEAKAEAARVKDLMIKALFFGGK